MATYMKVFNHGTGKIDLTHIQTPIVEATPIEFHFKKDGEINDKPSLAIVMLASKLHIYGQMSLNTLRECLNEVGFEIVKTSRF